MTTMLCAEMKAELQLALDRWVDHAGAGCVTCSIALFATRLNRAAGTLLAALGVTLK